MQLANEQLGFFDDAIRFGRFLEYEIKDKARFKQIELPTLLAVQQELKKRSTENNVFMQIAFGAACWDAINPDWRPKDLKPFAALTGIDDLSMPTTQSDLLIYLSAHDAENMLDLQLQIYELMANIAILRADTQGIKNKESRDLIGFVDGTANPKDDKRLAAALIPEGEAGAGGSYVLAQRWQHDLKAFNHLSIPQQEKVVGRTKQEDIELEGDDMPADSHVSRTDAKVDGVAMKIYRKSLPYLAGQLSADESTKPDHGLYFFAFACEMQRFEVQLERMLGIDEAGISDQLMKYSVPKTGSYWFMPNEEDLSKLIS